MKRHGDVKVEGHVVDHADDEVENDKIGISWERHPRPDTAKPRGKHKAFECDKKERWKGQQVNTAGILPENVNAMSSD